MLELVRSEQTEGRQVLRRVLAAVEAKARDCGVSDDGKFAGPGLTSSSSPIRNDGSGQSTDGDDATASHSVMKEFPGSPGYYSRHCGPDCKCQCHITSITRLVFNSLFGWPQSHIECNEPTCNHLQRMTFSVLRSFRQITVELWIEGQSLTHVSLRMPRIVGFEDFIWLQTATLDQVRQKLSRRELTVHDVHHDPDGHSVLHVSVFLSDIDLSFTVSMTRLRCLD